LDTEGETQVDNKRETIRGGFVLIARNSVQHKRRNSLVEKSSNFKTNILKGLRLRKQRSTGDIDVKSNKSTTPSLVSSRESETGSAASFKEADQDVGSNASFLSQNGDISDPTTTETYMGEWKNDKRCGFGVCERSDGLRYEGEWYNNKKYGYGVTIFRDGTREEGKYKNNQLVTNVRKKHLFVIRSTKVRERIESAVSASHRAQQIALQKADIAISRTATARSKGEQADFGASAARNDSQMAFITAKQYGGADISQQNSLEAPLRRRLSDFSQIRRSTRDHQHDNRNIAQQQTQPKQFLDPNEPFGGRRGSFRVQQEMQQQQQQQQLQHKIQQQLQQHHQMQQLQQIQQLQQHQNHNLQQPVMQLPHQHQNFQPPQDPFGQAFSDHFDQYRTLVSKYSNLQKQRSIDQPIMPNIPVMPNIPKQLNKIPINYSKPPTVESTSYSSVSNSNANKSVNQQNQQNEETPDSGISLNDECLNRRSGITIPNVLNRSPNINNNEDTYEDTPMPTKQWRTASLYRPTLAQNQNLLSSASSSGLKRKPSLQPNVVKQVNKPIMSREEVSVLSHNRREQQRIELEMKEKLAKNPFLYLFNPQFKNWLSRQQLVMLVLVINISLAILFFKLLI
jgi:junctophilin